MFLGQFARAVWVNSSIVLSQIHWPGTQIVLITTFAVILVINHPKKMLPSDWAVSMMTNCRELLYLNVEWIDAVLQWVDTSII